MHSSRIKIHMEIYTVPQTQDIFWKKIIPVFCTAFSLNETFHIHNSETMWPIFMKQTPKLLPFIAQFWQYFGGTNTPDTPWDFICLMEHIKLEVGYHYLNTFLYAPWYHDPNLIIIHATSFIRIAFFLPLLHKGPWKLDKNALYIENYISRREKGWDGQQMSPKFLNKLK